MPAKSDLYWRSRSGRSGTTWYQDRLLDWYADLVWKDAFRRLRVWVGGKRVIDVGCGDGKYSHWLVAQGAREVLGVDLYDYRPVPGPRARFLHGVDAEKLSTYGLGRFDLALVSGVLEFVSDWRRALGEVMDVADEIVVMEDMRETVPSYKQGLYYENPITWAEFRGAVARSVFRIERWVPANVLDRMFIVPAPRWLWPVVVPLTAALDLLLVRLPPVQRYTRFRAVHLKAEFLR